MVEHQSAKTLAIAISEIQSWLGVKLRTGHASFGLVCELAFHMLNGIYDVHTIYDEIGILEENDHRFSSAKGARQFKHEPLRGLWYKHHHQASFLLKNLMLEMHRTPTVEAFLEDNIENVMSPELIQHLVYEVTVKNYDRRASQGRLTGEWIVYERTGDRNYYLTLGHHDEGDEVIKKRIDAYRLLDAKVAKDQTPSTLPSQ